MVASIITLMLMTKSSEAPKVHRNPNLIIALLILILVVAAALLSAPQKKSSQKASNSDEYKVAKNLSIKELGVKLDVTQPLKNMTYTVSTVPAYKNIPSQTIVRLQSKDYSDLVNKCVNNTSNTPQYFSGLIKEDVKAGTKPGNKVLKQFPTFYIEGLPYAIPSDKVCKGKQLRAQVDSLNKKLNQHLEYSFKSAQLL